MGYLSTARHQSGFTPGMRVLPVPASLRRSLSGLGRFRGLGANGTTQATCTDPNYWDGGLSTCCAPLGTPAAADPCSILNQQGFLQAQAADVGPINPATGVPISSGTGVSAQNLAEVAGYPQNVQIDALNCQINPGLSFVDSMGIPVTCPSESTEQSPGIFISVYTTGQLAAMLAKVATPTIETAGNVYGTNLQATPTGSGASSSSSSSAATSSYPLSVRLVNQSGGSNSSFNVGDSWQIVVSGTPNAQVSASASQNGTSLGTTSMGTIAANGQLVLTGTFTASQAGSWVESWTVGGQSAGSISFAVASGGTSTSSAGGSTSSTSTAGGGSGTDISTLLSDSVSVAGYSVPVWGLAAAAVVGLFLFGGRR